MKINIVVYENLKEELMKKFLKSQRGVTLIILVITIIIIAILTGASIRKMDTGKDIRNYNYMCADIELLKNKVCIFLRLTLLIYSPLL